jgi:hypothetical protein
MSAGSVGRWLALPAKLKLNQIRGYKLVDQTVIFFLFRTLDWDFENICSPAGKPLSWLAIMLERDPGSIIITRWALKISCSAGDSKASHFGLGCGRPLMKEPNLYYYYYLSRHIVCMEKWIHLFCKLLAEFYKCSEK